MQALPSPMGVWGDTIGNVYISQFISLGFVRKIATSTGQNIITSVTGTTNNPGGSGAATSISVGFPWGLSGDSAGNIYVAENAGRVRQIDSSNGYTTVFPGDYSCE